MSRIQLAAVVTTAVTIATVEAASVLRAGASVAPSAVARATARRPLHAVVTTAVTIVIAAIRGCMALAVVPRAVSTTVVAKARTNAGLLSA